MRPPKTLIRIGAGLLIVIGVVLVLRAVLNFTEGRALARTLAGLKSDGVPLTAKDLAPPCPDEDNAARLLKALENVVTIQGRPLSRDRRAAGDSAARGFVSRAWNEFSAGRPLTPDQRSALKELIAKNERAFELMAEMGEKPCFLYRDPAQSLLESRLPDAIQMLAMTRLLLFAALFDAEDGLVDRATAKIQMGLRFTPLAAQEGTLISCLIAVAETRILAFYLGDLCRGREIGDETLSRLIDALDPRPWPARLAAALRGERVLLLEAGTSTITASFKDIPWLFGDRDALKNAGIWAIRPLVKRDIRESLPLIQKIEAQAALPYYQIRSLLRAHDQKLKERPWYALVSKAVCGGFEAAFMKEAMLEAILLASRTGLACRLHKGRTGAYPDDLGALVPGLLGAVPIDPFTGKPLIYRRDGGGFVVYSLGSNEKDDGGRSTFNITQMVMDKDDDWAWREDR
jgi:hypothetical protein